jgi:hypothetical protein
VIEMVEVIGIDLAAVGEGKLVEACGDLWGAKEGEGASVEMRFDEMASVQHPFFEEGTAEETGKKLTRRIDLTRAICAQQGAGKAQRFGQSESVRASVGSDIDLFDQRLILAINRKAAFNHPL